jgi:hypothetical protein
VEQVRACQTRVLNAPVLVARPIVLSRTELASQKHVLDAVRDQALL